MLPKPTKYVVSESRCKKVKNGHTYVQWAIALLSSTIFLEYGLHVGWVSPMKKILQSEESPTGSALTDIEVSFIASASTVAAIVGAPVCLYVAEVYGRKKGVLTTMSFYAISWGIKLLAKHAVVLIVARIFGGIAVGGSFIVVPMYVREISQDSIKGTLVSLTMSFHHIGVLVMYVMGAYFMYYTILWIALSTSIGTILLMLLAPESPAFLVKKGMVDVASKSFANLRGLEADDELVKREIDYMIKEDDFYKTDGIITFATIFRNKSWRRGFFLCLVLVFCIAFHGSFDIVTFAWSILTQAGVTVKPELQSFIIPIVLISGSVVPVLLVERVGRKLLLTITYLVSAVSLGCLGSALLAQQKGVAVPIWVPGMTIAFAVFAYSAGVLPVPNVIMTEMFKFQVRGKLLSIIHVFDWLCTSLHVFIFVPVTSSLGMYAVFYICMAVNLLGALTVLLFLPETKGRTTEEIENILAGKKTNNVSVS